MTWIPIVIVLIIITFVMVVCCIFSGRQTETEENVDEILQQLKKDIEHDRQ